MKYNHGKGLPKLNYGITDNTWVQHANVKTPNIIRTEQLPRHPVITI
jgi:hypothetical protein